MAQPPKNRPKRQGLGSRARLTFKDLDPNFSYRIINDTDGRLELARDAGWEFVRSSENLGEKRVSDSDNIDSRVSKHVGHGVRGYLMRIPIEDYREYQQEKRDKIDEIEKAITPDRNKGQYGDGLTTIRE